MPLFAPAASEKAAPCTLSAGRLWRAASGPLTAESCWPTAALVEPQRRAGTSPVGLLGVAPALQAQQNTRTLLLDALPVSEALLRARARSRVEPWSPLPATPSHRHARCGARRCGGCFQVRMLVLSPCAKEARS